MKNLFLSLVLIFVSTSSAFAFIESQYMITPQYMQNTGYSVEMARIMTITNQDPYREPYVESHGFKDILKRSYNYIAPGTYTDLDFYNHNGNFNNPSWKDL